MEFYKAIIKGENWQTLNWLWSIIHNKTDYNAKVKNYLNVGESEICELEVYYFSDGDFARQFINMICDYWGQSLHGLTISVELVEI